MNALKFKGVLVFFLLVFLVLSVSFCLSEEEEDEDDSLSPLLSRPSVSFGHYSDNLYVYINGAWMTLQAAIDDGLLGPSGGGSEGDKTEGLRIVSGVQTGYGNSFCLVRNDGYVMCSGYNGHGQLGLGDTINRFTFKQASSLSNVKKVVGGMLHFCALYVEGGMGKVKCWGYNGYGQLGVGDYSKKLIPTSVKLPSNANISDIVIRKAYSGRYFVENTCALASSGEIYCWGYNNNHGILGNGSMSSSSVPRLVSGINNAKKVVLGGHSTGGYGCALLSDGKVKCWGYNGYGQLGDGTRISRTTPVYVSGIDNAIDIIVTPSDYGTSCAILSNGKVKCWGYNYYGQIGNGSRSSGTYRSVTSPVEVVGIGGSNPKALKIVSSGSGTKTSFCALLENGDVSCWGYSYDGRIGVGSSTSSRCLPSPTKVSGLSNVKDIQLTAWGDYGYGCALLSDGKVKCWGYNGYGQLGRGSVYNAYTPVDVLDISSASSLVMTGNVGSSFGATHSTGVILSDGSIRFFGYNANGGFGTGDTGSYKVPVKPM